MKLTVLLPFLMSIKFHHAKYQHGKLARFLVAFSRSQGTVFIQNHCSTTLESNCIVLTSFRFLADENTLLCNMLSSSGLFILAWKCTVGDLRLFAEFADKKLRITSEKSQHLRLAAEVNRIWQVPVLVGSPNIDPCFVCLKCHLICGTNKDLKGKIKTATVAKHGIIMVKDMQFVRHTCKHDEGGRQKPKKQG